VTLRKIPVKEGEKIYRLEYDVSFCIYLGSGFICFEKPALSLVNTLEQSFAEFLITYAQVVTKIKKAKAYSC
jgi:hypothetical protein